MSEQEQTAMPTLGAEGAPCANCGSPLATDQRYCLECGTRRGDARLPYERYLGPPGTGTNGPDAAPATAPAAASNEVSALGAILGVALLGGMLLIGVLLGRGDDEPAAPPQTVVQTDSGALTEPTDSDAQIKPSNGPVTSEWPQGKDGFTIELGTLPKEGTTSGDVEATKADLESQGATGVGVLDSDLYPSLPGGNYVVYSGVYDTRADADAAITGVKDSFPNATVIEVSQKAPTSIGGGGGTDSPEAVSPEVVSPEARTPAAAESTATAPAQPESAGIREETEPASGGNSSKPVQESIEPPDPSSQVAPGPNERAATNRDVPK